MPVGGSYCLRELTSMPKTMKPIFIRFLSITIVLMIWAFAPHPVLAQKNPKRLYIQNEKRKRVSIKFKYINNLIIIPVQINSSDTLNFILDTGISNTILQTNNPPGLKPLTYSKDFVINGLGEGKSLLAHHSVENSINICGITGEHQDLLVIDNNEMKLSNLLGIPIHGLIGYELFKDLIVEINYDQQLITFNTHKKYKYRENHRRQVVVPITIDGSKPFINATITQADSSKVSVHFLLDLGASYALWVNMHSCPMLKLPAKTTSAYLGLGLSGIVTGKIGRMPKVSIDKFDFTNVLVSFPDTQSLSYSNAQENRHGSFGAEMISRFNLIIDYRNQKLTLTPNGNYKKPFRYNMSGMEISAVFPGQPIYVISYIQPFSPAQKAGLEIGDMIMEINGEKATKLSITEITGYLVQRPGKKIRVHYNRDGVEKYTVVVLNDQL
jgi:hypothetical protein